MEKKEVKKEVDPILHILKLHSKKKIGKIISEDQNNNSYGMSESNSTATTGIFRKLWVQVDLKIGFPE